MGDESLGWQSIPPGNGEQADQIILTRREAKSDLSKGKTTPEAVERIGVTGKT